MRGTTSIRPGGRRQMQTVRVPGPAKEVVVLEVPPLTEESTNRTRIVFRNYMSFSASPQHHKVQVACACKPFSDGQWIE